MECGRRPKKLQTGSHTASSTIARASAQPVVPASSCIGLRADAGATASRMHRQSDSQPLRNAPRRALLVVGALLRRYEQRLTAGAGPSCISTMLPSMTTIAVSSLPRARVRE
jgi:hypothetical protein